MVSNKTKTIILILTVIVIAIMAYLVHSPKFVGYYKDSKSILKDKDYAKGKPSIKSQAKSDEVQEVVIEKPKIKIGISLPLTGDDSLYGTAIKQAIEIAQLTTPKDSKFEYKVIFEDSAKSSATLNTYNFVETHKIDAVLSVGNDAAEEVGELSDKYNLPHITCAYGKEVSKKYKNTLNHFPTPETAAKAFVENLENNDLKIFSVVAMDTPYIRDMVAEVEKEARKKHFPILNKMFVKKGTKNFEKEVNILAAHTPDAVMVMLEPDDAALFAEQIDGETPYSFVYTSIDMLSKMRNKELIEGASFVVASGGNESFKETFANYSDIQIPSCAANMYDAYRIFVDAYEKTADETKPTTEKIVSKLKTVDGFLSSTGWILKVDADKMIDTSMTNVKIKDGKIIHR